MQIVVVRFILELSILSKNVKDDKAYIKEVSETQIASVLKGAIDLTLGCRNAKMAMSFAKIFVPNDSALKVD